MKKIIGLTFGLLALLAISHAEARTHISFGFGANVMPQPVYVQEYYPAHVVAGSRVIYQPVPVYQERVVVYPRPVAAYPMLSFRMFR